MKGDNGQCAVYGRVVRRNCQIPQGQFEKDLPRSFVVWFDPIRNRRVPVVGQSRFFDRRGQTVSSPIYGSFAFGDASQFHNRGVRCVSNIALMMQFVPELVPDRLVIVVTASLRKAGRGS